MWMKGIAALRDYLLNARNRRVITIDPATGTQNQFTTYEKFPFQIWTFILKIYGIMGIPSVSPLLSLSAIEKFIKLKSV